MNDPILELQDLLSRRHFLGRCGAVRRDGSLRGGKSQLVRFIAALPVHVHCVAEVGGGFGATGLAF